MRITAIDLRNHFLGILSAGRRATVTVTSNFEGKQIQTHRNYIGSPLNTQIRREAANAEILPEHITTGDIYMSNLDICGFLNEAWETIHNARCDEISARVAQQGVTPQEVDSLVRKHGVLAQMSPLLEERDTSTSMGPSFTTSRQELTSFASHIFVLPDEMIRYGKPCIINGTLEVYDTAIFGGTLRPTTSRILRFVSSAEFSTYISLAENSEYSAGVLARSRPWMDTEGRHLDIVEVFYNEQMQTGWLNFFGDANLYITLLYIEYPAPLDVQDITGTNTKGESLNASDFRVIECDYPYEIARLAADNVLKMVAGKE